MIKIFKISIVLTLLVGCSNSKLANNIQSDSFKDPKGIVDLESAKNWLKENVTIGKSTKRDIFDMIYSIAPANSLNTTFIDLDRPEKDNIEAYEYLLPYSSYGNETYLVLYFDKENTTLKEYTFSHWICGFCPHIFANDGRWRLEGKMLPSCIGKENEGTDTLLLPRLKESKDGLLKIKISNLAPEIEYINKTELLRIPLNDKEELDIDNQGYPIVWKPQNKHKTHFISFGTLTHSQSIADIKIQHNPANDVAVFEVRNTFEFELAMRRKYLQNLKVERETNLIVDFGNNKIEKIKPVGTKFLRRVVIPLPQQTNKIEIKFFDNFWHMERMWIGSKRDVTSEWMKPIENQSIRLEPMEDKIIEFRPQGKSKTRSGYALRMFGHYEFINTEKP